MLLLLSMMYKLLDANLSSIVPNDTSNFQIESYQTQIDLYKLVIKFQGHGWKRYYNM